LEELVMILRVRPDLYPFDTAVHSEQLYPTSQLLSELTGVVVQPNKAIVGGNAFAHEAGIHQDGMIKNTLTYEIMTPRSVGVTKSRMVLGRHSGRHALGVRCQELGFQIDRSRLERIYESFLALADTLKVVDDKHIVELVYRHPNMTPDTTDSSRPPLASNRLVEPGVDTDRLLRRHDSEQQEDYLWGV
jgi:2-isopropylmalate synthase